MHSKRVFPRERRLDELPRGADIETLRSLTEDERQAVLSSAGSGGVFFAIFVVVAVMATAIFILFPLSWTAYLLIVGSCAGALLVLKVVVMLSMNALKRDVAGGQKAVLMGVVEERLVNHIELTEICSVRVRVTQGVSQTFPIPNKVYDHLHVNDEVELCCLPVSRMLLSIRTQRFQWALVDAYRKQAQ